ncbi:hypothetical protein WAI453_003536 [Rhynchosporium graminicola]
MYTRTNFSFTWSLPLSHFVTFITRTLPTRLCVGYLGKKRHVLKHIYDARCDLSYMMHPNIPVICATVKSRPSPAQLRQTDALCPHNP